MKRNSLIGVLSLMIVGLLLLSQLQSQPTPRNRENRGDRSQRGSEREDVRGGRDMQQMMGARLRDELNLPNEQWQAIQPKLRRVMELQRELNPRGRAGGFAGRGGGMGQPGARGGGQGPRRGDQGRPMRNEVPNRQGQPTSDLQQKIQDLEQTLSRGNATEQQILSGVAAVREARQKARQELQAAQKDLLEGLSARQGARLILMGMAE